ncbi:hypothetical protein [Pseudomonas putida]|uniref:hypothetical protein n=1 Tax=Pseudomonas putida TaxID=303 RepID=UPI0012FE212C|nr:hypothetical protein [Pseudomonas putida]
MSATSNIPDKIGKPLSVGGITTLLIGLCSFLPKEHQQVAILASSFISPILVHAAFLVLVRVSVAPELTQYIGSLKRDLKTQRAQMKQLDPEGDGFKKLKALEEQTILLLATAHQDHSSGKLSLKSIPRPSEG